MNIKRLNINDCKHLSVGIIIPTLNAGKLLPKCLPPLLSSTLKPRILVVDSSSKDNTVAAAKVFGVETIVIDQAEFNHGKTREMARKHLGTDIVVMVTPDAIATDHKVLEKLILPIIEGHAAAAYARQIPHDGAGFFEAFPREFNYPATSHIRSLKDNHQHGIYTYFCSNSFAAYSSKALDDIGGFKPVLLGEDTLAVAQLLHKGYNVAYVSEAIVKHSHNYTLRQEFRRYFDTGLARKQYAGWIQSHEKDSHRGSAFAKAMLKRLLREKPYLLPYACVHLLAKWTGYKLGQYH